MTPQYIARVLRARGFSYCRQSNHLIGFCSGRYALRCQRKSRQSVLEVPRYSCPRLASPVVLQMIQAFLEPLLGSTVWFVFRFSRLDGR